MTSRPGRRSTSKAGPPSVRRVTREQRWAEIVQVTSAVIAEKGVSRLRLRDVADQLGFNHQALYYYVGSKDELVHAVLRDAMKKAIDELRSTSCSTDPGVRLAAMVRRHVELTVRERYLFRIYERVDSLPRDFRTELESLERDYVRVFHDCVEAAIAVGAIPVGNSLVLTRALLGMTTWTYRWAEEMTAEQLEAATQDMLRLVSLEVDG